MTPVNPFCSLSPLAMPFMIPGSRMSTALRAYPVSVHSQCLLCEHVSTILTRSEVLGPPSPPQSGCESVTPRSQAYPDTPPVLDADIFDTVPFSVSIYRRGVFDHGRNTDPFVVVGLVLGVSGLPYSRRHASKRHHHPGHCPGSRQGCQAIVESS
jgi:hypothetical protein